jgi:hypothetical protein
VFDQACARGTQLGVRCFEGGFAILLPPLPQRESVVGRAEDT